ncbi:hypothetical protein WJX84_003724 [Apatococcus fuscideae]|uniref:Uncharacterized protein n=1 Tax=Apatococcus fuscideae TaxID=2026836 RepID=A0AAW1SVA2_9CHLO
MFMMAAPMPYDAPPDGEEPSRDSETDHPNAETAQGDNASSAYAPTASYDDGSILYSASTLEASTPASQ